jgi:hypothetical protein
VQPGGVQHAREGGHRAGELGVVARLQVLEVEVQPVEVVGQQPVAGEAGHVALAGGVLQHRVGAVGVEQAALRVGEHGLQPQPVLLGDAHHLEVGRREARVPVGGVDGEAVGLQVQPAGHQVREPVGVGAQRAERGALPGRVEARHHRVGGGGRNGARVLLAPDLAPEGEPVEVHLVPRPGLRAGDQRRAAGVHVAAQALHPGHRGEHGDGQQREHEEGGGDRQGQGRARAPAGHEAASVSAGVEEDLVSRHRQSRRVRPAPVDRPGARARNRRQSYSRKLS